ncbi:transglycosylase domain-containing protein [Corynebacterium sp. S7]
MTALKSLAKLLGAIVLAAVVIAACLAPFAGIGGVAVARTNETMQSNLSDLTDGTAPGVTTITDINGEPMAWLYNQRRYEVPSEAIAQSVKDALVAVEDRRFYEHDGVDIQGTVRALFTNLLAGGVEQGASTIDQQYVKNYLLLVDAQTTEEQTQATEQSIPRKLREMKMASDLDKSLSKEEILGRYLNLVSFGNHAYGIEAAAQTYYGISASELSVPQAALLVGIVQSSEALNPYYNPEGATERRNTVLQAMADAGYIQQDEADTYIQEPLGILESPATLPNGCIAAEDSGFLCDYALKYLQDQGMTEDQLRNDSYTIRTTLEPDVQAAAHNAVTANVDPNATGVAGVMNVIRPGENSRDIAAMVSSRNYGLNADENQTYLPQPTSLVGNGAGSVFKLFTAAVAIEKGMGIDTKLQVPQRVEVYGMGDGGAENCPTGAYCVENTGSFPAEMTLKEALSKSPNTPFVNLIEQVGVSDTVDMAVKLGLRSYTDEGTYGDTSLAQHIKEANLGSFTLGPTPVNALELSNVGATIASGGRWCQPNPIAEVTDRQGQQVYIQQPDCENVMDSGVAYALADALGGDAIAGTAEAAAKQSGWTAPVSAKTGTTESNQSSAFIGFNGALSAAPYIFNDGTTTSSLCSSPVRQCASGNLFGGREPAQMWFNAASNIPGAAQGQLPAADSRYLAGNSQTLLDKVKGLSETEARKQLEAEGYKVQTSQVAGNGVPRGDVVNARSENQILTSGSTVILEISDGTSPAPAPTQQPGGGNGNAGATNNGNTGNQGNQGNGGQAPAAPNLQDLQNEADRISQQLADLLNSL